jgi:tetratricopeptide (TPR) repeat protein
MNNLLAGLFAIVSLVAYLRHAQAQSRRTATLWYAAAIGSLVLALLAKPTAVVVPLLAAAIDLLLVVRSFRRVARSVAPLLLIAAAFAIVARLVQPAVSVRAPSPLFRVVVALDALAFYFAKLVWPVGMNIDYGRTPQWLSEQTIHYYSWTVPAAAFAISWIGRRRWPGIFAGLAIFVISLIPVLGLVPFDFQQYSTVADRYAYLGMLGVSISLAGILSRINRRGVLAFVGVALTLVLGVLSFLRAGDWHDSRILFARTFDLNPQSLMANRSIAAQLIDDGRPREAEIFAQRAVDFHPGSAEALMNLAAVYMARGELSRAAEQYQKVLAINPDDGGAHYSLAAALAQSGQLDAALVHARRSVELNPLDAQAHLNLGTILAETGQTDAAIEQFETAARISPDDPRAHANLGQMLLERGLRDEAIAHFEAALRADPRFAPAAEGLRRARAPATMP